jgi:metal-responsive CopG/Arc/MetJ family transcriptional regulator
MKVLSISISEELLNEFNKYTNKEGINKSSLICKLIEKELKIKLKENKL